MAITDQKIFSLPRELNVRDLLLNEYSVIANKFLAMVMYESNLDRFVKVQFYNYTEWISCVLVEIFSHQVDPSLKVFSSPKIKLNTSVLADLYESIIGAAFMCRFSLLECYQVLKNTEHPIA